MMKMVVKLQFDDQRTKQKAMKRVSSLSGVDSIAFDPDDKKLTVIGDVDPLAVVGKLRKLCDTDLVSVGPAKEPEKEKGEPKTEADKKNEGPKVDPAQLLKAYQAYCRQYQSYPQTAVATPYYYRSVEEDPNSCGIC